MRVWIQSIERPCSALCTDWVVIQWNIYLWHVLTNVVSNFFTIGITELQEVWIQVDTVLLVISVVRLVVCPQILIELISWIEPSEGPLCLKVTGTNPERSIGIPGSAVRSEDIQIFLYKSLPGHKILLKLYDLLIIRQFHKMPCNKVSRSDLSSYWYFFPSNIMSFTSN